MDSGIHVGPDSHMKAHCLRLELRPFQMAEIAPNLQALSIVLNVLVEVLKGGINIWSSHGNDGLGDIRHGLGLTRARGEATVTSTGKNRPNSMWSVPNASRRNDLWHSPIWVHFETLPLVQIVRLRSWRPTINLLSIKSNTHVFGIDNASNFGLYHSAWRIGGIKGKLLVYMITKIFWEDGFEF